MPESSAYGWEVLEDRMKVVYDPEVDVLSVLFSDAAVADSLRLPISILSIP
jgi:hypothetical protein